MLLKSGFMKSERKMAKQNCASVPVYAWQRTAKLETPRRRIWEQYQRSQQQQRTRYYRMWDRSMEQLLLPALLEVGERRFLGNVSAE